MVNSSFASLLRSLALDAILRQPQTEVSRLPLARRLELSMPSERHEGGL